VLASLRQRAGARAGLPRERVELLPRVRELLVAEAAARASDVEQPLPVVRAQVERAEAGARALRPREADHHEVPGPVGLELQPVGRASAHVRRVRALRHDALEPELRHLLVEGLALARDVVRVAQRARGRHQHPQGLLARDEGQRAEVVALEREQVEHEQRRRPFERRPLQVRLARELHALLQALEAGTAALVEHHHLAVQHQVVVGQALDRARDLGEDVRRVSAATVHETRLPALARGQQAEAVVLELEEPAGGRERLVRVLGQHGLEDGQIEHAARRVEPLQLAAQQPRAVLRGRVSGRHPRIQASKESRRPGGRRRTRGRMRKRVATSPGCSVPRTSCA
jgi:hypothetical protein